MTIDSSVRKAGPYAGNNSTTVFPFSFKVFDETNVSVTLTDPAGVESTLLLNSDYSVSLNGNQEQNPGGVINYPISGSPLGFDFLLTLSGSLAYEQPTAITNQGGFYPRVIEDALDRATIQIQQLAEKSERAVQVPVSSSTSPEQLIASLIQGASDAVQAASNAQQSEANAGQSEINANQSELNASQSEVNAGQSELNALAAENKAKEWASKAEDSPVEPSLYSAFHWAQKASASSGAASQSEINANQSELNAGQSALNASQSEFSASQSEINAGQSELNASTSENNASTSEANAKVSELAAKAYFESLVQPFAFMKQDYDSHCFVKTGAESLSIKAGTSVIVSGIARLFIVDTPVETPVSFVQGEDYSVWVKTNGDAVALVDSYVAPATPPENGAVKIGGFHFGLVDVAETVAGGGFSTSGVNSSGGSMAWTQTDVDALAGINVFSFWDLAFRKKGEQFGFAFDPLTEVWSAIYFCSTEPHLNGISRYNTDVASGTVLPFVPPAFGGDGVLKYSGLRSWEANELALAHGCRLIRYEEFVSAAFGVTEGQSLGGGSVTIPATKREAGYTSRIGLEQATGHAYTVGGPMIGSGGSAWASNGRGSNYGGGTVQIYGGHRADASFSGSRCVDFVSALSNSYWSISLRAAGDSQKTKGPVLSTEGF